MTGITGVTKASTSGTATEAPLSGAALRREQGRREMRAAILDEARRLLTEDGASALSMRAIARALGYSPAALYEYFPSKEDIFAALYFEGAGGLAGRLVAVRKSMPADSSVRATLHEMGRAYRDYAHEQPETQEPHAVTKYEPAQVARAGAEREANTKFASTLADRVSHDAVEAEGSEEQSQAGERADQPEIQPTLGGGRVE